VLCQQVSDVGATQHMQVQATRYQRCFFLLRILCTGQAGVQWGQCRAQVVQQWNRRTMSFECTFDTSQSAHSRVMSLSHVNLSLVDCAPVLLVVQQKPSVKSSSEHRNQRLLLSCLDYDFILINCGLRRQQAACLCCTACTHQGRFISCCCCSGAAVAPAPSACCALLSAAVAAWTPA
jgi:hypothetical protein